MPSPRRSALAKTGLRELQKRPRPMRQAESVGRQAMFFRPRHLAEGEIIAIGKKNGIVAKPFVAARRPNQRAIDSAFKLLDMAVRPGDAQRRHEVGGPGLWRHGAVMTQLLVDFLHNSPKILARASPPAHIHPSPTPSSLDPTPDATPS